MTHRATPKMKFWRVNWAEHFTAALNHPSDSAATSLDSESASAAHSPEVLVDEPTLHEAEASK